MKRFVLITSALVALVAAGAAVANLRAYGCLGRQRDTHGDDAEQRPDTDVHM